jgi:hypothetical protein
MIGISQKVKLFLGSQVNHELADSLLRLLSTARGRVLVKNMLAK